MKLFHNLLALARVCILLVFIKHLRVVGQQYDSHTLARVQLPKIRYSRVSYELICILSIVRMDSI